MAGRRRAGEPDALALANQIPDRRFLPQASVPDKEQHNADRYYNIPSPFQGIPPLPHYINHAYSR